MARIYTILLAPRPPSLFGALSLPGIPLAVLGIALVVSALASWSLARHLSAPIRRLQEGARLLASEQLDGRVSMGLERPAGRTGGARARLRRDGGPTARRRAAREPSCCAIFPTNCARRSRACASRWVLRASRNADPARQLDRLEREIERLDELIGQVLKLARLQGARAAHQSRAGRRSTNCVEEVVHDANFEGAAKDCAVRRRRRRRNHGAGKPRAPAQRDRERAAQCRALQRRRRDGRRRRPTRRRRVRIDPSATAARACRPADLQRIFEPFYRVAESRDRDSGGEGIGLAITAQVLKAHTAVRPARETAPAAASKCCLSMPVDGAA